MLFEIGNKYSLIYEQDSIMMNDYFYIYNQKLMLFKHHFIFESKSKSIYSVSENAVSYIVCSLLEKCFFCDDNYIYSFYYKYPHFYLHQIYEKSMFIDKYNKMIILQ